MKILLDTRVLLWWLADSPRLGSACRAILSDRGNKVYVSTVSIWEIAIKVRIGKLQANVATVIQNLATGGFSTLAIHDDHLLTLVTLPAFHRDPFDHMLVAQAIFEDAVLFTSDAALKAYPVRIEQI